MPFNPFMQYPFPFDSGMPPMPPGPPPMAEQPMFDEGPTLEELAAAFQASQQPAAPMGFMDRLALGLSQIQPQGRGAQGFVSGLASSFGNTRLAGMQRGEQERARRNQANLLATQEYLRQQEKRRDLKARPGQIAAETKARIGAEREFGPKPTATPAATRVPVPAKLRPYVAPGTKDLTTGELSSLMQTYFPTSNERLVQIMGPGGAPVWVRESEALGKPAAQAARAVTGAERQALSYYNRAKDAAASADELEQAVAGAGTAGQIQLQYAPNMLKTSEQRRYRQAQRAFTEARLRKESGAAIPLHEVENDSRTYFAQPGDDPQTIEQKRLKRQTVLDGLAYASGRAYDEYYGEPMTKVGVAPGGGAPRSAAKPKTFIPD